MINKENKIVPKLRFPEFVNEGEWKEKKLCEVCERITQGGTPDTTNSDYWNGSIEWITPAEMGKIEHKYVSSTVRKITKAGLKSCSSDLLPKNSVILSTRAPIGHLVINKTEMGMNQGCKALIPDNHTSFEYLYYCLLFHKNSLSDLGAGNTFKELSANSLKNFEIYIPKKNEQQKIASCLSSLDELIAAHTDKLEALKDHKKGLMQQLFPAEGETVPKLRFKEFEGDGEWVEKIVEDFFDVGSSKRVLEANWTNQGVPFYRTRELVSLSKNLPFGSEIFISEELYNDLKEKYGVPKEGDFLVSGVGTLGICYQVKNNDKFYYKDGNVLLFSKKVGVESDYFKYCFQSEHIQNQILNQTAISTVGTYTIQNAKKTTFWYPPTTTEQQKIANFLSSIDDEIAAQAQKIEGLKEHKKGLMQGLFPVMSS